MVPIFGPPCTAQNFTKCHRIRYCPVRWVFSHLAIVRGESEAARRVSGRLPGTAKLLVPSSMLILGINSNIVQIAWLSATAKYGGASPCIHLRTAGLPYNPLTDSQPMKFTHHRRSVPERLTAEISSRYQDVWTASFVRRSQRDGNRRAP